MIKHLNILKEKTIPIFCFVIAILISSITVVTFAASNFGVVQDPGNLLNQKTIKVVDEVVMPVQTEYKNQEFHLMLAPEGMTDDFSKLSKDIANNYKDMDSSVITVFLIYKLSDHSYRFIIDESLKSKISPVFLTSLMEGNPSNNEVGLINRFKNKQYDDGVLDYIPRMAVYFASVQNYKSDQQDAMAGAIRVNPENFIYKKIFDIEAENQAHPSPQPVEKKNRSSLWFMAMIGIIAIALIGVFGYRQYKKYKEDKEFDEYNTIDEEYDDRDEDKDEDENSYSDYHDARDR